MLINEQMRRYIERMEEIEQLEYAETLAKNQLKLKRSNTVRAKRIQTKNKCIYVFYFSPSAHLRVCLSLSGICLSSAASVSLMGRSVCLFLFLSIGLFLLLSFRMFVSLVSLSRSFLSYSLSVSTSLFLTHVSLAQTPITLSQFLSFSLFYVCLIYIFLFIFTSLFLL